MSWWFVAVALAADPGAFSVLEPGLELGVFDAPQRSAVGDSRITVLRVDPARFDVVVLHAAAGDGRWRTAKQWSVEWGLVAATNPGMFEPGGSTTFYSRAGGHVSNPTTSPKAGAMLVSDPSTPGLPGARVVDLRCEAWTAIGPAYATAVQSYRLFECDGSPAWKPSARVWSHAVVGEDRQGRILFVHARSPWNTHDFAAILRALPLDVKQLTYGEGGPEATLYVHAGPVDREWVGSFETGFREADDNVAAWPLPNVVGLRRRPE